MKKVFWFLAVIVAVAGAANDSASLKDSVEQKEQLQTDTSELYKEFKLKIDTINTEYIDFKSGILDKGLTLITILVAILGIMITFFGIGVPVAGFIYGRNKLKELKDMQKEAEEKIENWQDKAEKKVDKFISDSEKTINASIENTKTKLKSIEEGVDNIMESKDLKENEKDKEQKREMAKKLKDEPKASPYERALAEAAEYYFSDKFKEALKCYEKILEDYKNEITVNRLTQIYYRIAYSYKMIAQSSKDEEKEKLLVEAIEKFNETLKLNPKLAGAYNNLGKVFIKQADLKTEKGEKEKLLNKAIEKFNEALKIKDKYASAYYNLGDVLMRQVDLKTEKEEKEELLNQAESACIKCRNLEGKVYNLACVYALKSDKDKAFKYLEKALEKKEYSFDYVENDLYLASLRNDQRYQALKEKYS